MAPKPVNVLSYPLGYLSLSDQKGRRLYRRNWAAVFLITVLLSAPFVLAAGNYFGGDGFLDRFGRFSAVLTGFYIAALVGVASFASTLGDLDDKIEVGPIYRTGADGAREPLTRRQYVCAMFGYLAFLSLFISVFAIVLISLAAIGRWPYLSGLDVNDVAWEITRAVTIVGLNLILSHMIVTTCYGLYYLVDRLYYQKARILPKPGARV